MPLSRKKSFESIKERLEFLQISISNSGSLNLNDQAIHAENFFRDLLNLVYGWQLENANAGNQNAADIDLIDRGAKLAIQVTARNDRAKISDTLDSFYSKDAKGEYRFKFMLISKEALKYKTFIGHEDRFDPAEGIIGIKRLLREISDLSTERVVGIAEHLEREIKFPTSNSNKKTILAGRTLSETMAMVFVDLMRLLYVASSDIAHAANSERYPEFVDVAERHFADLRSNLARFSSDLDTGMAELSVQLERRFSWILGNVKVGPDLSGKNNEYFGKMQEIGRILNDFCIASMDGKYEHVVDQIDANLADATKNSNVAIRTASLDNIFRLRLLVQSQLLKGISSIAHDMDQVFGIYYFVLDQKLLDQRFIATN